MTYVYAGGLAVLIAVGWLGLGVWRIGAVSQGVTVGARAETALLLVDLQTAFWDDGPYDDAAKAAAQVAIFREIDAAKAAGHPVVALRQEWSIPSTKVVARLTMQGAAVEGTVGTGLADPFVGVADHVLVKRVQDGFETGELDALMEQLDVGRLRIVGLDFCYCVQKTALAARNRGYEVTVVRDATLASGPTEKAVQAMTGNRIALN
ncbi:cysteine hydrolase family protein [Shimia sp. W99]